VVDEAPHAALAVIEDLLLLLARRVGRLRGEGGDVLRRSGARLVDREQPE
jgi:hypothetical protein